MDQDRFDRLAKLLAAGGTRRAGLRAALGAMGLLGIATLDADAAVRRNDRDRRNGPAAGRKRRHECGPDAPCPAGYDCVRQGRKRRCSCASGVTCDGACCPSGQVCQDGACTVPATCVAPGGPCKGVGRPCCDGRVCASGQGGEADVACYIAKTGACETTADCVYMTSCVNGRCALNVPPAPLGGTCDASLGQQCEAPGAVCTAYTAADAPAGPHCTLPLEYACTGDPDCTCYHCGWTLAGAEGDMRREGRAPTPLPRLACCGPAGFACRTDRNCCIGGLCVNGRCQAETTCDVCASGCPYTTVNAAVADTVNKPAGSTITVEPGVYETSVRVGRSLTIRPCGGADGVILQNASGNEGRTRIFGSESYLTETAVLTLLNLTLRTTPDGTRQATGIRLDGSDAGRAVLYAAGCTFENLSPAVQVVDYGDVVLDGCSLDGCDDKMIRTDSIVSAPTTFAATRTTFRNAASSVMHFTGGSATLTDCTVSGGRGANFQGNLMGGGILLESGSGVGAASSLTLAGSTRVTGNRAALGGGVALVGAGGDIGIPDSGGTASLVMSGTSSVTGNTATEHGSGIVYNPQTPPFGTPPGFVTASGTAGRVSGNGGPGAQCELMTAVDFDPPTYAPLPTCTP